MRHLSDDITPTSTRQPTFNTTPDDTVPIHVAKMIRTYEDSFSGAKIYPGKGRVFVRGDSKFFRFQRGKSESLFKQRKNPRRIAWTVLYRRAHRKGLKEEAAKKRTRRTVKAQRAIVGAPIEDIEARRRMRPEARAAQRAEAAKDAKDAKAKKNAAKAQAAAQGGKTGRIQSKQGARGTGASKPAPKTR
jgi:large subunit ribosomal protein L24e